MAGTKEKRGTLIVRMAATVGIAAAAFGMLGAAAGCGEAGKQRPNGRIQAASDVDKRLVESFNGFGFELYRKTSAAAADGDNMFMSPASAAIALTMTMNGAVGPTRDGMAQSLGVQGLTPEEVNGGASALLGVLQHADPQAELTVANSIWARKGLTFDPSFIAANKTYFGAETKTLDFASRKAADTINGWAKKQTKGRIDKIVADRFDDQSIMVLLNAVYFKADWTRPFEKTATRDRPFTLQNGTQANRSMMASAGTFEYADRDGYTAVRLPYGNGNTGMVALLPDEGTKLSALVDRLNAAEWNGLIGALHEQQGEVVMPRFKMEVGTTLNEPLMQQGMSLAFDPERADFSKLLAPPPNAYIGDVKQKTFVQVDEKGTEAAAVTKVEMKATSAPSVTGFRFELNRPFLFAIHERQTGIVLFIGSVYDPQP
ncbi:serpin family protein [Paenibacillus sp. GYB003]|uniref:serpin family protein n=1 Tax=Paenibacillus sp. GYB003 TaxID=2994392 RepID=UPI002F96BB55